MKAIVNERNKWAIHDFSVLNQQQRITGTKLQALYKLIQKKGEPIKAEGNELINGVKALEYDKGCFVAMIHTPIKKASFFPCMLKTINLKHI
jgi:hypothetical protein